MHPPRMPAAAWAASLALALAFLAVACGDKSGTDSSSEAPPSEAPSSEAADKASLVARGQMLHKTRGCAACHSLDGSRGLGPTYAGLFNSTVDLADGATVTADAAYLRSSIIEPAKHLRSGFQQPMQSYAGLVGDDEIEALIAFIEQVPAPAPK